MINVENKSSYFSYISYFINCIRKYFNNNKTSYIIDERELEANKYMHFNRNCGLIGKRDRVIEKEQDKSINQYSSIKNRNKNNSSNKVIICYENGEYIIGEKVFNDSEI